MAKRVTVMTRNIPEVPDGELSDAAELRLLRAGVARLNDAVMITEIDATVSPRTPTIRFVNVAFERLTGWRREEILGLPFATLEGLSSSAELMQRVRMPSSDDNPNRVELMQCARDGREFWAEVDVTPIYDGAGRQTHWISIYRDITDRRGLEAQLFHSQKMDAVGRLAGGVAHDFNNVLTAIGGFSELLLDELEVGTNAYEEVQQIKAASDRAAALTRQLLAFSRKQIMRPRHIDVNALIQNMERLIRRVISANVSIRTKFEEPLPSVHADPMQFEQVLLNLVVNASEAMADGGILTIESSTATLGADYAARHHGVKPGAYVCLIVTDTGAGMDRGTREQIFEPFFTTKSGGTGLGLSTVYGIVRQTGGHVWVYSELAIGTTFKVYLPVSGAPADLPALVARVDVLGGRETVIVVEDEPAVRDVVRAMLERRGYTVLLASDGEQALRLARSHSGRIDLLLTDVVLPRTNGRRVAELLSMERPGIKVLYMSGYTEDAMLNHGALDEGVILVEKPFTDLTLAQRIRELLDGEPKPPT